MPVDHPLIRAALRRDLPAALGHLYDAFGERLHAWLTAVAGDPHLADDVLQEVFVAVARRPALVAAAGRLDTYLFGMARNALRMALRGRSRRPAVPLPDWLEPVAPEDAGADEETRRLLQEALADLPVAQREVVALKCFEDRTFAEIGALLTIPPNTAASRYRYAMAKLRERLGALRHA